MNSWIWTRNSWISTRAFKLQLVPHNSRFTTSHSENSQMECFSFEKHGLIGERIKAPTERTRYIVIGIKIGWKNFVNTF